MRNTGLFLVALWMVYLVPAAQALEPANPKTNARARAILNYLEALPQKSEKRLISGQFTDFGPGARLTNCEDAFKKTGRWPGMIGIDYADFGKGGLHYATVNRLAIAYAQKGGLVTISAHLYNPANPRGGGLRDQGVDLKKILTPGNEAHDRWMKELDILADGLKELKDADVVVLWRPFHEMNGGWFWWGAKDPDTFIQVWRHMFDHFTRTRGLDNLLWVYSPNHGSKTAAYYAGDRYVDIVGLDAYTDFVDPQHIKGYEEVAKLPKPFGFTEFGPHGPSKPPGNYDYLRFLTGVQKHFPRTCFFLAWHWNWGLGRNQNTRQLLEQPWLINREDLPAEFASKKIGQAGEPIPERLKEVREAFARLGAFEPPYYGPSKSPKIPIFDMPRKTTDADLKTLPNVPFPFGLGLLSTLVTDAGLKELTNFNQLTLLDLASTKVTDAGLKELKNFNQLIFLRLESTQVTDTGLKDLKDLRHLSCLGLKKTKVTDAGLKELKGLKQLTTLDLGNTRVTDAGLKELKGLDNLADLSLFRTHVTDVGLKELKDLKHLTRLDLFRTEVTDAGLKELREALPHCDIEN